MSATVPARLEFACGHASLVGLPRIKGEGARQQNQRVSQEKLAARTRPCDFCGPIREAPRTTQTHTHTHVREESRMDSESTEPSPTTNEADARPVGVFPPPRKLTTEQERELTRQYAETSTPIADIARTFRISEVSVGRIAQRNGAASRRRRAARDTTPDAAPTAPSSARRGRRRRADAEAESTEGTGAGRRRLQRRADEGSQTRARGRRQSVSAAAAATAPEASPSARGGARRRFRIRFFAETVVEADNVRDALGKAEALGATDITGIVQESG